VRTEFKAERESQAERESEVELEFESEQIYPLRMGQALSEPSHSTVTSEPIQRRAASAPLPGDTGDISMLMEPGGILEGPLSPPSDGWQAMFDSD